MPSTPAVVHHGVLDLITQAGPVVQLVMLLLLFSSVMCWAIIFSKWRALKRAVSENTEFLNIFWHGKTIDDIMARSDRFTGSPVASVFRSGVRELHKLSGEELANAGLEKMDNIQRALTRATNTEIATLEKNVSWLATTASAAPFVGLFGTVWGIMNSFQSIGASGSANLAVVAPGISEALIATAIGLAAAIPAVIAYNHFAGQIRRIAVEIDAFTHDFTNIIQRSVIAGNSRKGT